jgi:hypothetical protein
MIPGLAAGRVAHYVDANSIHKAATITAVIDPEKGIVDLVILDARSTPVAQGVIDVPFSEKPVPHSWHWPEKV